MKANCPSCQKDYSIPDERLKIGESVSFHCKDCNALIKLRLELKTATDQSDDKPKTEKASAVEKVPQKPDEGEKIRAREKLKKKILQNLMGNLPPMPQVVFKAQDILANPNSSIKDLVKIIATDQAITTRVLKLANSTYYGLSGKVSSIGHASVLLGGKILGEVIMMAGSMNLLGKELKGYGLDSEDLWQHSLAVGIGSRLIAVKKFPELANDAFTGGIIHDTGKIMLDKFILEKKEEFDVFLADGEQNFLDAETEILGLDHSEIGAEVCQNWGVPTSLTNAIRYHHSPSRFKESELAYVVHMADYIAATSRVGEESNGIPSQMDDKAMVFLSLVEEDLEEIKGAVEQSVESLTQKMQTG